MNFTTYKIFTIAIPLLFIVAMTQWLDTTAPHLKWWGIVGVVLYYAICLLAIYKAVKFKK